MTMIKNVGGIDRVMRIILGIVFLGLVSLAFVGPQSSWAYLGFIGFIPLVTGIIGFCPPYTWFGINTCKKQNIDSFVPSQG